MMNAVIIGTGRRALNLYIPVIKSMKEVELYGLCGKNYDKTQAIANKFEVKAYRDFEDVISDKNVDLLIIAVSWTENRSLYLSLEKVKIPVLIETPLGKDFNEASDVFTVLSRRTAYTDIAEQYHLRPIEQLKKELIDQGLFGEIFYAFVDGAGHEYHAFSLIRFYLGFDLALSKIAALQKDFPCFPHTSHQNIFFPGERVQHALLEFDTGALGAYHWSWLAYESPIRARRISGFHGTKGICSGEDCSVFENTQKNASRVFFKRKTRVVEGIEVISEIIAMLEDKPIACWYNPFDHLILDEERIVAAMFINNLIESGKTKVEPLYSPSQAYQDHIMLNAMNTSINSQEIWKK